MEQHYIVIFSIVGESIGANYTATVIISEYPGNPHALLCEIYTTIEKNSIEGYNKLIRADKITIKNLTLVYQK